MADYGVSMDLMDQISALGPDADPTVVQALSNRLQALGAKHSGPQDLMPQDVQNAPGVAVFEEGFGDFADSLVGSLHEAVNLLGEPQEPVFTDEDALSVLPPRRGLLDADPAKQRILVLPTGSLYGLRADSTEHMELEEFVQQGGVIVCFTQPYGDDFSALPVPQGEELLAAGFKQDLSCFANSAYPTMEHPILSGIAGKSVTAGFDGFFRKAPASASVLLRRTISGQPCLIAYPVGKGWVVASTMYEDWAYANGQSTKDGRTLVANILSWAKDPGRAIPSPEVSRSARFPFPLCPPEVNSASATIGTSRVLRGLTSSI
jgi:hypothetical protein